jgi:hypothetical protein
MNSASGLMPCRQWLSTWFANLFMSSRGPDSTNPSSRIGGFFYSVSGISILQNSFLLFQRQTSKDHRGGLAVSNNNCDYMHIHYSALHPVHCGSAIHYCTVLWRLAIDRGLYSWTIYCMQIKDNETDIILRTTRRETQPHTGYRTLSPR